MKKEEKKLDAMSKTELDAFMGDHFAFTEGIRKSGHYLPGGQKLQPAQTATTVRVLSGNVLVTDGPFAETKEQLGGFYLINARDLNEAIQVASKIALCRHRKYRGAPDRRVEPTVTHDPDRWLRHSPFD